jgi:hypothetical protein
MRADEAIPGPLALVLGAPTLSAQSLGRSPVAIPGRGRAAQRHVEGAVSSGPTSTGGPITAPCCEIHREIH